MSPASETIPSGAVCAPSTLRPCMSARCPHLSTSSSERPCCSRMEPSYYKASLQVSGTGLLVQDGREAVLQPGDLAIYDTGRPYSLLFENDMRMLVLMFPREHLGLPPTAIRELTAHRFSSDRS